MKIFGREFVSAEVKRLREINLELDRQLDDIGWMGMNSRGYGDYVRGRESYKDIVKRSRVGFAKNPLIGLAVQTTTHYTFGEGVQTPKSPDQKIQAIIDRFWKNQDNKLALTSSEAQIKLSNKIQYDGEILFAIQVDRVTGECYVRILDPILVDVVYDKFDSMRPAFYSRAKAGYIGELEYIPDVSNGAYILGLEDEKKRVRAMAGIPDSATVIEDMFVYQVKINNDILDRRGVPEVYRALDWVNSNSKINGDMSSFINAQSQYAVKKTVKGTKAQVQAQAARIRQNPNTLNNPSYQAGATLVQNDLVDTQPIGLPSSTGGLFETGIRRTLLMVCAAFGIMEHYFGDPSTGNLATTTAMELPMLKKFLARQKFWEDVIVFIINFRLDMNDVALEYGQSTNYDALNNRYNLSDGEEERIIDVDFPPILAEDLEKTANAFSKAKNEALMPIETCQRKFMGAAGVTDIDAEMEKEFHEKPEFDPFGGGGFGGPPKPGFGGAQESVRMEGGEWYVYSEKGKRLGGPYSTRQAAAKRLSQIEYFKNAREAALPDIVRPKAKAAKLADKNRAVLGEMSKYLKEISRNYRSFNSSLKSGSDVLESGGKWRVRVARAREHVRDFISDMDESAGAWFPKAAKLGKSYAASHGATAVREAVEDEDFIDAQLAWNRYYLESSLTPYVRKKLRELELEEFETEELAKKAVTRTVTTMESRVAMYATAFWTVEEKAVKESSRGSGLKANFVGVDDGDNCPGCQSAIDGNPWVAESVPSPGEQDCLGNCRHAIQFVTDEDLTSAEVLELAESEKMFRDGVKLLGDE